MAAARTRRLGSAAVSLTIMSVAYPLAPVRADSVGGAEQVLARLDAALTRAGHRSIVIACQGSKVFGELVGTPPPNSVLDDAARQQARAHHRAAINAVLRDDRVDLVHMHGIDFAAYVPSPGVNVLVTLHLPLAWYPREVFSAARPGTWLNCVSHSQRRDCPPEAGDVPVVGNGIPLEEFAARRPKRRYAMALGRICPETGFDLALRAARRAKIPLALAGQVYPYEAHQRHFEEAIRPLLDRRRRFLGPIGGMRKRRLLAAARCLLVPSLVPETSSLVAMEALASGTPVIAFAAGALAEIVEPGRTGFLVADEAEMADAIREVDRISPAVCRQSAQRRFDAKQMVDGYFGLYRSILNQSPSRPALRAC